MLHVLCSSISFGQFFLLLFFLVFAALRLIKFDKLKPWTSFLEFAGKNCWVATTLSSRMERLQRVVTYYGGNHPHLVTYGMVIYGDLWCPCEYSWLSYVRLYYTGIDRGGYTYVSTTQTLRGTSKGREQKIYKRKKSCKSC